MSPCRHLFGRLRMELSMHRSGMSVFSWCGSGRAGAKLLSRSATTRGNSQSPHARRKPGHRAFPAVRLSAHLCPTPAPLAAGRGALRTFITFLLFPACRAKPCRSGDAMVVRAAALPQLKDER